MKGDLAIWVLMLVATITVATVPRPSREPKLEPGTILQGNTTNSNLAIVPVPAPSSPPMQMLMNTTAVTFGAWPTCVVESSSGTSTTFTTSAACGAGYNCMTGPSSMTCIGPNQR